MGLTELLLSSKAKDKVLEITSEKPILNRINYLVLREENVKCIVQNKFMMYYLDNFYVTFNERTPIITLTPKNAFKLYEEIKIEVFFNKNNTKVMDGIVKKKIYEKHRKFKWIFYSENLLYKFLLDNNNTNKKQVSLSYEKDLLIYN